MRFTHKQIWVITFPILVSLLMEHLINMTDTAFLGRVGEVELGASALAGVYYMAIYMRPTQWRRQLQGYRPHFYTRGTFPRGTCHAHVHGFPHIHAFGSPFGH